MWMVLFWSSAASLAGRSKIHLFNFVSRIVRILRGYQTSHTPVAFWHVIVEQLTFLQLCTFAMNITSRRNCVVHLAVSFFVPFVLWPESYVGTSAKKSCCLANMVFSTKQWDFVLPEEIGANPRENRKLRPLLSRFDVLASQLCTTKRAAGVSSSRTYACLFRLDILHIIVVTLATKRFSPASLTPHKALWYARLSGTICHTMGILL